MANQGKIVEKKDNNITVLGSDCLVSHRVRVYNACGQFTGIEISGPSYNSNDCGDDAGGIKFVITKLYDVNDNSCVYESWLKNIWNLF
jgi:hypothetical protein